MTHGSLFSGIGGFDLAAEWMGWENKFHCEWNEFCKRVLKYYWPDAKSYGDIDDTDFTIWRGCIDVLSGGFPCQPYSTAGKRHGKEDVRHKWPQMLRAIREIQPGYVVGENVRGITNWNGGLVFDEVQADLEAEGYEVLPFLLPACGINAPHRRDRIWFVAHACGERTGASSKRCDESRKLFQKSEWKENKQFYKPPGEGGVIANSNSPGLPIITCGEKQRIYRQNESQQRCKSSRAFTKGNGWNEFPTKSPICRRDDGLPSELDGITFSKWRNESVKAYGNAIVPQVAYEIFKVIEQLKFKS
jgi:DNA (cytosine-5)-methyltransferase 1